MRKPNPHILKKELRLFGSLKVLMISSLLVALSVVLGKLLAINITQSFRISFENLPILFAGIAFGPFVGGMTGLIADLVGCLLVGYAINPLITLGAVCIGVTAGLFTHVLLPKHPRVSIPIAVAVSHLLGSVLIKSLGIYLWYGTPLAVLWLRIPIYLFTGAAEAYLLFLLFKSRAIRAYVEGVYRT